VGLRAKVCIEDSDQKVGKILKCRTIREAGPLRQWDQHTHRRDSTGGGGSTEDLS